MLANRILSRMLGLVAVFVIPVQLITTLVLGLLVNLSSGFLLLPITLVWILFSFPMIGASWLTSKFAWLRNPIGLIGIPWAIAASTFVVLMPSMGELESRAAKLMLTEAWPYSWECWKFQIGEADLYDPHNYRLLEVIDRLSRGNLLMQRTVSKISAGEELDLNV